MKKWLLLIAVILVAAFTAVTWFYQSIQHDIERAREHAIARALSETSLTEVKQADFFAGEANYVVLTGENEDGEALMVWVGEGDIHERKTAEGVTRTFVRSVVIDRNEEVNIIRLTPGVWNEQDVWEVFYKKQDADGERYYYDYYHFSDGKWLDTYRLNVK